MLSVIYSTFQTVLVNLLQLAAGCLVLFIAVVLKQRGIRFNVHGRTQIVLALLASSFLGLVLPLGPFGSAPVVAVLWLAGLELPLALPLLISNFLFNLSMPLTGSVFIWNGNISRIAAAFAAGVLAGLLLSQLKLDEQAIIRKSAWRCLFARQEKKANYFIILRDTVEAAGLFIVAGAILRAAFSANALYWLQNQFFSSSAGLTTMTTLSKLDVFNPIFGASVQILGRLIDFSALACFVFLFRAKHVCLLYIYYAAIALVLSVGLFF
jgi:uncharacterized membrane protein YraQ (UPF0718 family)